MSTIQPKRVINTIAIDPIFRLRALIYSLAKEGYDLPGICRLLGNEYMQGDIERIYRKRDRLPRYIHVAKE